MKSYDVAIVGAGPFGVLCAWELQKIGASVIVLDPKLKKGSHPELWAGLGVAWTSPQDPPTRVITAHGLSTAQQLSALCQQGATDLAEMAKLMKLELKSTVQFRYGIEPHEFNELNECYQKWGQLQQSVFQKNGHLGLFGEMILNTVSLPSPSEWVTKLQSRLNEVVWQGSSVSEVIENSSGVDLLVEGNECVRAEICVLSCGSSIGKLFSKFKEILIPVQDTLINWSFPVQEFVQFNFFDQMGSGTKIPIFSARGHNGHVSLSYDLETQVLLTTGPRFLPVVSDHPSSWIKFHVTKTLPFLFSEPQDLNINSAAITATQIEDVLPCDELPVVGEIGKLGRVFGSTGFFGYGLSSQARVARVLVQQLGGKSDQKELSFLSPSRLFVY